MKSNRLNQLGATLMGAAFLTASAGLMAAPGQEPDAARRPDGKVGGEPSPDDQVEALVREYDDVRGVMMSRPIAEFAKDREKWRAESEKFNKLHKDIAGRLLELAGRYPRTNAAEQALTWIVCNDTFFDRSAEDEADRAREILARDHVRSDRIKAVLAESSPLSAWASPTTEDLLRRALGRSPYYEIRGLACNRLAELLIERAERVRIWQLLGSPPQSDNYRIKGGPEQFALMRKSDPDRLEEEAARLLERVVAVFPRVTENHSRDERLGRHLEASAKPELDRLRRLSIGELAPEITGVDLDGKPMRLSDYRGKVVVLYFSPYFAVFRDRVASREADIFRKLITAFAGKPFAIAGVITWQLDDYRKEFRTDGLPVRFWADQGTRSQMSGSIHSAWGIVRENSVPTYYVLDPLGTIRYYLPGDAALIEKAVSKLLEEQAPAGRAG